MLPLLTDSAFFVYPLVPCLTIEIHAEAIVVPDRLPAIPIVPYNPPGHYDVTKSYILLSFSDLKSKIEPPLADNPYLWQSRLIVVTPSGTTK